MDYNYSNCLLFPNSNEAIPDNSLLVQRESRNDGNCHHSCLEELGMLAPEIDRDINDV